MGRNISNHLDITDRLEHWFMSFRLNKRDVAISIYKELKDNLNLIKIESLSIY